MFGIKIVDSGALASLVETITLQQRQLEDLTWDNLNNTDQDLTQYIKSVGDMLKQSRTFAVNNPLAVQAMNLTTNFVFGEGLSRPKANDKKVQEIIDEFWDDPDNKLSLTSYMAQIMLSNKLQYEGNIFFLEFIDLQGNIKLRVLNSTEVVDIIRDPRDRMRTAFYKVKLQNKKFNFASDSYEIGDSQFVYYPDADVLDPEAYGIPSNKIGEGRIYHVKVNSDINDKFGVSDLYVAVAWMRANKVAAQDLATMVKALSQFAWKKKVKGNQAAVNSIAASTNTASSLKNIMNTVGRTHVENQSVELEAVNIKDGGAKVGEIGIRQTKLMVCAGVGIFEHYFGDPSTGNLATAKSMELPMIKKFQSRQKLWQSAILTVLDHLIREKIEAGELSGSIMVDNKNGRRVYETTIDTNIDIDFPPIVEDDVKPWTDSLVIAKDNKLVSRETAARKFMSIANIDNIDDEIQKIDDEEEADRPEEGEVVPSGPPVQKRDPAEPDKEGIHEAIDVPDKVKARESKKYNFMLQKTNGYRKVIAGNFNRLKKRINDGTTLTEDNGEFYILDSSFRDDISVFIKDMQDSAVLYFPQAVDIGEKYMKSILKDLGIKESESFCLCEVDKENQSFLREKIAWNDQYLRESLEVDMVRSVEDTVRVPYESKSKAMATVNHAVNKYESRLEMYVGAFWTVEEGAVKNTGKGSGLMVNFGGPDDESTCQGCIDAIAGNPWPIDQAPVPGSLQCYGRCRHILQVITNE